MVLTSFVLRNILYSKCFKDLKEFCVCGLYQSILTTKIEKVKVLVFSHVQLCVTPWTVACQASLPWDSPGKNTGVGLPFPSPGNLPNLGIKLCLLCLLHWQVDSLPLTSPGKCPVAQFFSRSCPVTLY